MALWQWRTTLFTKNKLLSTLSTDTDHIDLERFDPIAWWDDLIRYECGNFVFGPK